MKMNSAIHHTDAATNAANAAAVAAVPFIWAGYLQATLALIATMFTIVWMGLQITIIVREWMEKRESMRGPKGREGPQGPQGDKGDQGRATAIVVSPINVEQKAATPDVLDIESINQ